MADAGYAALLAALVVCICSAVASMFSTRRRYAGLVSSVRIGLLVSFGLLSAAVAILTSALLTHNFQIEYVAVYTNLQMSPLYLISALWAGFTGSLLFWAWLLSIFATVVVLNKRNQGKELIPYALAIIMAVQVFFLVLLVFVANPFHKLAIPPADGIGLNPMFENLWMLFHAPTLLAGYAGFTVPFAFALAALVSGRLDDGWIALVRRWALFAWIMLGVGIIVGAWWAYAVVGWGGYWAWDPVENTSLMPWLVATAFLHSIMMQRRRGMLKIWNMVLIIITFGLTILGTFLTQSGIVYSIKAFAKSDTAPFFLVFIGITIISSLGLLFYRRNELRSDAEMESIISRESTFLLNNLLLVGSALVIFLGTVFPVIYQLVSGVRIDIDAPFFNLLDMPVFLAVILLAGICTLIGWRRASVRNLLRNFLWPLVVALALGIALFTFGVRQWYALVAFVICGFVVFTILSEWLRGTRARHRMRGDNYLAAFWGLIWSNRPRYGGYIVHIAIILIAVGIIGSSVFNTEKEAVLLPGDSMTVGRYTLTYDNLNFYTDSNRIVFAAALTVYNGDEMIGRMVPEKYFHRSFEQSVNEVAIRSTLIEDLYVILMGWDENEVTSFKVVINPLVSWIWIGGVVMVVGGLVAFWPNRSPRSKL